VAGPGSPARILLQGRPGSGKSTAARRLIELLAQRGVPVAGFVTEEIREGGQRVGFGIETVSGERGVLAHVEFGGPPRVGKYGVDLEAFERLALPQVSAPPQRGVTVIDELGKMELASAAFRESVERLFESPAAVVATVHVYRHPLTERLKHRADVELVEVSQQTRERLPEEVAARLA
jgi:nucleoside-triphosphatase